MTELTSDLITWIEAAASGTVESAKQIPAGGRQGFFVDVRQPCGEVRQLFLQLGRRDGAQAPMLFHDFEVEAQVFTALEPIGVPVPHVWGLDHGLDALLVDRVPGVVWFQPPRDPAEQDTVAKDFITHLARWHTASVRELDLPALGPVKSLREHQSEQLDGITKLFSDTAPADALDPLVTFTLDWLRSHIPEVEEPVVLVQGDTGPGNFLHADGKVTAVLDWELAHLGDPMDDIAWLSWRATQHGFPDFPARLREYERLTGIQVDDDRVRYYRLNAFGRLGPHFAVADMGQPSRRVGRSAVALEDDRSADGSFAIMSVLHRRMRLEATAAVLGTPVPSREVADAPSKAHERLYDRVLDQLQTMVGRIDDRATASLGKGIARQLKYLKELDRNGDLFATEELGDISGLLGKAQRSVRDARPALVAAVRDGGVGIEAYLDYQWRRLRRDDHLMRFAAGALHERSWPELR